MTTPLTERDHVWILRAGSAELFVVHLGSRRPLGLVEAPGCLPGTGGETPGIEAKLSDDAEIEPLSFDHLLRAPELLQLYLIDSPVLRAGWQEPAFRQEVACALVMLPAAFWVGQTWIEIAVLWATVLLVMIVELLNSSIEAAIDRIGPEWHSFSKSAKDMGSAAVLLSILLCAGVWIAALWQRIAA